MPIELGTVGWEGDDGDHYDLGTDDNDGHTFIKVQLYSGRNQAKKLEGDKGQGKKIVCHLSSHMYRIPPVGTRVYVAIPDGMEAAVGSGLIIGTIEQNPTIQFDADRAIINFGEDTHIVFKGKSVSISDFDNQFISVGTPKSGGDPGIIFQAADGSGGVIQEGVVSWFVAENGDAKNVIQMTTDSADWVLKGCGFMKMSGSEFITYAPANKVQGAGVYLGKTPTAATFAGYGATAPPTLISPSVFISPV